MFHLLSAFIKKLFSKSNLESQEKEEVEKLKKKAQKLIENSKPKRKEENEPDKSSILGLIWAERQLLITLLLVVGIFVVFLFSITQKAFFSDTIILPAVMSLNNDGTYNIGYLFEQNIENIYPDTKSGDKMKLNRLMNDLTLENSIYITYINREKGTFITSLPHTFESWSKVYNEYEKLKKTKNVMVTLEITPSVQEIKEIQIR